MPSTRPEGHLALPAAGTGNGVLVLHAWWGLNETIKSLCSRLAESGFVAFAPDLYHGQIAQTVAEAEKLSNDLDGARGRADASEAARYLREHTADSGQGLAVIGFSLGAYFALDLSARDPESVRSAVIFYGTGPADYEKSKASYLGHFAESDPYEPPENVQELEEALRQAGRPFRFHRYPGTGHWFFEPDRTDAFDEGAAALAWDRTLAFLRDPSV
jgi:carboxymethylenebutenolidase